MASHKVQEGESLISIAAQHGFKDWRSLYYYEANAELRALRPDPMQLIPGDSLEIPPEGGPELECTTGQSYTFQLHALEPTRMRIKLLSAEVPYVLIIDGKEVARGTTEADGMIDVEVPANAKEGKLRLWEDDKEHETVELELRAGLQPVSEEAGVRARLENLGYLVASWSEGEDDPFSKALRAFQSEHHLEPTGEVNDATRLMLAHLHP